MTITSFPTSFPRPSSHGVAPVAHDPSGPSAHHAGRPERSPSTRLKGAPVLVVDDDVSILGMVREVLSAEGYAVRVAPDGAEALAMVDAEQPAVVLLDMRMPNVDGWEFARRLRERGLQMPILVMTADRDAAKAASEIGADGFLAKPFEIGELLSKVSRFGN